MKKNILNNVSGMIIMLFALLAIPAQAQDNEAYAVLDDSGTLTFYYDALKATRPGTRYGMPANDAAPAWAGTSYTSNTTITKAVFDSSFADFTGLASMRSWFLWCDALTEVQNLENINTENLT